MPQKNAMFGLFPLTWWFPLSTIFLQRSGFHFSFKWNKILLFICIFSMPFLYWWTSRLVWNLGCCDYRSWYSHASIQVYVGLESFEAMDKSDCSISPAWPIHHSNLLFISVTFLTQRKHKWFSHICLGLSSTWKSICLHKEIRPRRKGQK